MKNILHIYIYRIVRKKKKSYGFKSIEKNHILNKITTMFARNSIENFTGRGKGCNKNFKSNLI